MLVATSNPQLAASIVDNVGCTTNTQGRRSGAGLLLQVPDAAAPECLIHTLHTLFQAPAAAQPNLRAEDLVQAFFFECLMLQHLSV
jgi:hypothetical protein